MPAAATNDPEERVRLWTDAPLTLPEKGTRRSEADLRRALELAEAAELEEETMKLVRVGPEGKPLYDLKTAAPLRKALASLAGRPVPDNVIPRGTTTAGLRKLIFVLGKGASMRAPQFKAATATGLAESLTGVTPPPSPPHGEGHGGPPRREEDASFLAAIDALATRCKLTKTQEKARAAAQKRLDEADDPEGRPPIRLSRTRTAARREHEEDPEAQAEDMGVDPPLDWLSAAQAAPSHLPGPPVARPPSKSECAAAEASIAVLSAWEAAAGESFPPEQQVRLAEARATVARRRVSDSPAPGKRKAAVLEVSSDDEGAAGYQVPPAGWPPTVATQGGWGGWSSSQSESLEAQQAWLAAEFSAKSSALATAHTRRRAQKRMRTFAEGAIRPESGLVALGSLAARIPFSEKTTQKLMTGESFVSFSQLLREMRGRVGKPEKQLVALEGGAISLEAHQDASGFTEMAHTDHSMVAAHWFTIKRALYRDEAAKLRQLESLELNLNHWAVAYKNSHEFGYQHYLHRLRKAVCALSYAKSSFGMQAEFDWGQVDQDIFTRVFMMPAGGGHVAAGTPASVDSDADGGMPKKSGKRKEKKRKSRNSTRFRGTCFQFNSQAGCSAKSCKFMHKCAACGARDHAEPSCPEADE
eukprot:m.415742 g.415742  ORF g.415742 m.415742 type:complete len:643 (-) comp16825_c0_seq6:2992-4920(-)